MQLIEFLKIDVIIKILCLNYIGLLQKQFKDSTRLYTHTKNLHSSDCNAINSILII